MVPLARRGAVPVVTGYIGATPEGITTTLGRNGSDYSAAIVGAAAGATEIWIWTDVDGVMSADPRLVPAARSLPDLSYAEAAELAYFGSRVIHPRTIVPAVAAGVPLRIKNTFHPAHPGTLIAATSAAGPGAVKAVTHIRLHGRMAFRQSSSRRRGTGPTEKRIGFPSTVWLGARETDPSPTNERLFSARVSPAWAAIRARAGFGSPTRSSYRIRRYGTPEPPTRRVSPL